MFLIVPLSFLSVEGVTHLCKLFLQFCKTLLAQIVCFFLKSRLFNLKLHNLTSLLIQLCRHGIQFCLDQGTGFIDQVDGFVRQEPVCDVSVRKCCCGYQCAVCDLDAMENFVSFFQSTKDGNGIFYGRLINHNRLETTCQCGIFLNVLTVLVQCGGTNTMQFTSGKHRFQHVACIHGSVCLTGSDDQVKFIDEEDDLSLAFLYFFKDGFETFLEFTTVLRTCDQCTHIQSKNLLILKTFRDITGNDSLCQSFDRCCLTDTRLTDQYRVVLSLTRKDTDNVTDLCITSDDRIKLLVSCLLDKILSVFVQGIISCFRIVADNSLVASHSRKCLEKSFSGDTEFVEDLLHARARLCQQGQEQMLHGNVLISHCLCFVLCIYKRFVQILSKSQITAGYLNLRIQGFLYYVDKIIFIDLHLLNQLENQAVFLCQQRIQKMLLLYFLVAILISNLLKVLNSLDGFLCKFTDIHRLSSSIS